MAVLLEGTVGPGHVLFIRIVTAYYSQSLVYWGFQILVGKIF